MSPTDAAAPDPRWSAGFAAWVLRTRSEEGLELLRGWSAADPAGWSGAYARCLTLLPDRDPALVRDALDAAARSEGPGAASGTAVLRAQVALRAGDRAAVEAMLAGPALSARDAWALRTDLANPYLDPAAGDRAAWLALLGEPFRAAGLEEPFLDDALTGPDAAPFTWLRARATAPAGGSDLVTVVVSAYRPGPDLLTAVRSLADQSWEALEILLVDDASGPEADAMLEQAAALDPRVEVVRAPRNAGTYAARNLALARARGRYVTFHDYDDWAHPRRVERQVRALVGRAVAGRSGCLRAYPDLGLTFPGYTPARQNASSLLLERGPATELVGGFHLVRKSADMEYPGRLKAARPGAVRDLPVGVPLAITQLRPGSLSRSDAVPGWTRWSRIAYRDQYREWHRRIAVGSASPHLPVRADLGVRRGPVPPTRSFSAHGDHGPRPGQPLDVVVVADFRADHTTLRRAAAELATMAGSGLRVGVVHAEPPIRRGAEPRASFDRSVARLVNDGVVRWADPDDAVEVGTVLVLDPTALLLRAPYPAAWRAARTVLCVRTAADLVADVPTGAGPADPAAVARAAEAAFGAPVTWRALGAEGLALVRRHGLEGPGLLPWAVSAAGLPARLSGDGAPRVGHGALDREPWEVPPETLLASFAGVPDARRGAPLDVRFAVGATRARHLLGGPAPAHWLFLEDVGAAADLGFAGTLDVAVLPALGVDGVAFARECLALGVPVLAPESHRPVAEAEDPAVAAAVTWTAAPPGPATLADLATRAGSVADPPTAAASTALAADRLAILVPHRSGG